jgi:hypothetical protein
MFLYTELPLEYRVAWPSQLLKRSNQLSLWEIAIHPPRTDGKDANNPALPSIRMGIQAKLVNSANKGTISEPIWETGCTPRDWSIASKLSQGFVVRALSSL